MTETLNAEQKNPPKNPQNFVPLRLTQEVVGADAVVVPDLQHKNSRLPERGLLDGEEGLLFLIHHLFLRGERTSIYDPRSSTN